MEGEDIAAPEWADTAGPGLAELTQRIDALRSRLQADGTGATLIITGSDRDGRAAILRAFTQHVHQTGAGAGPDGAGPDGAGPDGEVSDGEGPSSAEFLIAGRLERHGFQSWLPPAPEALAVLQRLEQVVPLATTIRPALQMLSLLVDESGPAWALAGSVTGPAQETEPAAFLPQLLRDRAAHGPVICVIDCAEDAQAGWWGDLIVVFAQAIAAGLPVLLVLGVEHASGDPAVTGALAAAAGLAAAGLAQTYALAPRTDAELAAWLPDAQPDAFAARLRGHVSESSGLTGFDRSRELLAVAALEGRQFAAEALALAMGLDRDAVIDHLDDALTRSDERPDGIVVEGELLTINDTRGQRHLWLYRFVDEPDFLALRDQVLDPGARQRYAAAYAEGLIECYGDATALVSATAARLHRVAGNPDAAAAFARLARLGNDGDTALWRAQRQLQQPDPDDADARRRAAEVHLHAATAMFNSGLVAEGLQISQAAMRLAEPGSPDSGLAHYFSGWYRQHLGQLTEARAELGIAEAIARQVEDLPQIANAMHQLANVDFREEEFDSAAARYAEVLELRVQTQDAAGVAAVEEMLGELARVREDFADARAHYANVLAIAQTVEDPVKQLTVHVRLAKLHLMDSEPDEARQQFDTALQIAASRPDLALWRATVLTEMTDLDFATGDHAAAVQRLQTAITLAQDNPDLSTRAYLRLGAALTVQSGADAGRPAVEQALAIVRATGDANALAAVQAEADRILSITPPDAGG